MFKRIEKYIWEIPTKYKDGMRVPGRLFVSERMLKDVEEGAIEQIANVATLPGIRKYSMAMPDVHLGYGFPIGGVAAFGEEDGIISPGGVGFDINCGVRLIRTNLTKKDVEGKIKDLVDLLFREVPSGVGSESRIRLSKDDFEEIFHRGVRWAVENGYGVERDIEFCEENGSMKGAKSSAISQKAMDRGRQQLGTLGSGNHFLEIQYVAEIYDEDAAKTFGLFKDQLVVMVHCGSRGFGHQVCTDHLRILERASRKYGIRLPDKQLACAPIGSEEAENYFGAMVAAANYAWTNRQLITHWVRESFKKFFGMSEEDLGMDLVYDVAHNVAKVEVHDGEKVYVHRKGATRAFGPGNEDIPKEYRAVGQPVIIPGSMGTPSFVLRGTEEAMKITFGSTCHGAGRVMSRERAKRTFRGERIRQDLLRAGIYVRATSGAVIAEEAPGVYKSSEDVVDVVHNVGISLKVAKMLPLGVAKG